MSFKSLKTYFLKVIVVSTSAFNLFLIAHVGSRGLSHLHFTSSSWFVKMYWGQDAPCMVTVRRLLYKKQSGRSNPGQKEAKIST